MTAEALFLFGTLRHAPLLACVAGADLPMEPAELDDHVIAHAVSDTGEEQEFPLLAPRAGAVARGALIRPDAPARARLDAYERVFGYDPHPVTVRTAAGPVATSVYLPRPGLWRPGRPWDLARWQAGPGQLAVEVASEVMALLEVTTPEAVFQRFRMLEARAASRRRARREPGPASLRRQPAEGDVIVRALRRPYTWFFGVEEADLQFRRFDGAHSDTVTRAGFIMADAVSVLPYDPVRDTVMLVEQFRFGPHARGDANPWSLEPIAGRIDPLETPEQAVRREAREEARLELRALHHVFSYYPSPGAITEFLISYVGIADLPGSAEGVSGLASEAEDIRAHVIGFDRLCALMAAGEVQNAPLLLSAQWLAMHRERLRAEAAQG